MSRRLNLHLFARIRDEIVAICQVVGAFDFEAWQPIDWAGSLEPILSEDYILTEKGQHLEKQVICDDAAGKFGVDFAVLLRERMDQIKKICRNDEGAHYGLLVGDGEVSLVCLPHRSGGLRMVKVEDFAAIQDINAWQRNAPIPNSINVMLPDNLTAMRQGWTNLQ